MMMMMLLLATTATKAATTTTTMLTASATMENVKQRYWNLKYEATTGNWGRDVSKNRKKPPKRNIFHVSYVLCLVMVVVLLLLFFSLIFVSLVERANNIDIDCEWAKLFSQLHVHQSLFGWWDNMKKLWLKILAAGCCLHKCIVSYTFVNESPLGYWILFGYIHTYICDYYTHLAMFYACLRAFMRVYLSLFTFTFIIEIVRFNLLYDRIIRYFCMGPNVLYIYYMFVYYLYFCHRYE